MTKVLSVVAGIFIAILFLRWLGQNTNIFGAAYPPSPGGSDPLLGGWPYAAPLPGYSQQLPAWSPPFGTTWQSYFGYSQGPNASPDISVGFQGWNL